MANSNKKKWFGYGNFYCPHCGSRRNQGNERLCPKCGKNYSLKISLRGIPKQGGGVGFSPYVNHVSLKKYRKREKKTFWVWAPIISLIIASIILFELRDKIYDLESFLAACLVPVGGPLALIWIFWFWWYGINYKKYKNWDGVVTNKEIREYDETKRDGNGNKHREFSTFYTVYFRDTRGKEHKLVKRDNPGWFDFFEIGEQVRYHGKYTNYYEKYDKSHLESIPCAGCGAGLDPRQNYCSDCGCIVLKAP
ncbi:MAG TPA: hypothetical protein DCL38_03385 [Lachnospiraceae bacterium]|nr:hypothetical protein [Lachnospiraceae bacterium]